MIKLKDLKEGYAIVESSLYQKYKSNARPFRILGDDIDDARYQRGSLERCDRIGYSIYDCKNQKLASY